MDIPINVDVLCALEPCGRSTSLIINPVNEKVTHVVVAENAFPNIERIVPVSLILSSTPKSIQLRCNKTDLSQMQAFKETDFIQAGHLRTTLPYYVPYMLWPYSRYEEEPIQLEKENIPTGEIAIHRGAAVKATDGKVGAVDEFLVDPLNDVITHLVLREGHLWGKRDVTIPVSDIEEITDNTVKLKLDKEAIEKLPAIPVNRLWK